MASDEATQVHPTCNGLSAHMSRFAAREGLFCGCSITVVLCSHAWPPARGGQPRAARYSVVWTRTRHESTVMDRIRNTVIGYIIQLTQTQTAMAQDLTRAARSPTRTLASRGGGAAASSENVALEIADQDCDW